MSLVENPPKVSQGNAEVKAFMPAQAAMTVAQAAGLTVDVSLPVNTKEAFLLDRS